MDGEILRISELRFLSVGERLCVLAQEADRLAVPVAGGFHSARDCRVTAGVFGDRRHSLVWHYWLLVALDRDAGSSRPAGMVPFAMP